MKFSITPSRITSQIVQSMTLIAKNIGLIEGAHLAQPDVQLRRKNRIQTIHASLAIEGNTLNRKQVTALLDDKPVIGPQKEILEVQNALAVYAQLAELDPLSMPSLLQTHALMMRGLMAGAGSFRKGPVGVLRENNIFHEAPDWERVEPMMQALFSYLKSDGDHLLIKSCRFHYQLEYIHPFMDGNGRMGRLWQTLLLMLYHPIFEFLPMEYFIHKNQQDYYRSLVKGDDTGDCTEFVTFNLEQIALALKLLTEDTRGITLSAENRLGIAGKVLENKTFSRKEYQNILKTISTATASRDLSLGIKIGLLVRSGDKRTARYRFNFDSHNLG